MEDESRRSEERRRSRSRTPTNTLPPDPITVTHNELRDGNHRDRPTTEESLRIQSRESDNYQIPEAPEHRGVGLRVYSRRRLRDRAAAAEQLRDRVTPVEPIGVRVYVRRQLRERAAPVEQLRRITISEEHINDNNSITSGCPICRINFELGEEDAFQTHCGHIYHTVCISTWLQFGNTCPACRRR